MSKARTSLPRTAAAHAVLILYTVIALFPVVVIVINSFKARRAIFAAPLALPTVATFDPVGYTTVLQQGDFLLYFQNSLIVTVVSIFRGAALRRDGGLRAQRIPVPRQPADGALSRTRHHDPDPARHGGDPAD